MDLKRGTVVVSRAGRDCGTFLAVDHLDGNDIYVVDGKERPLRNAKKKNPKHVTKTNYVLSESDMRTDKSLCKALKALNSLK